MLPFSFHEKFFHHALVQKSCAVFAVIVLPVSNAMDNRILLVPLKLEVTYDL